MVSDSGSTVLLQLLFYMQSSAKAESQTPSVPLQPDFWAQRDESYRFKRAPLNGHIKLHFTAPLMNNNSFNRRLLPLLYILCHFNPYNSSYNLCSCRCERVGVRLALSHASLPLFENIIVSCSNSTDKIYWNLSKLSLLKLIFSTPLTICSIVSYSLSSPSTLQTSQVTTSTRVVVTL